MSLDNIREAGERLHCGVPALIVDAGIVIFGHEHFVLVQPALRLNDLDGIGARRQHLREQRVRIKRDRSQQFLKLLAAEALLGRGLCGVRLHGRRGRGRRRSILRLRHRRLGDQGRGERESEQTLRELSCASADRTRHLTCPPIFPR